MWNQLSPQQQQFLMAMLMGQQQPGMMWGQQQPGMMQGQVLGNPLMSGGVSAWNPQQTSLQTGGNWLGWLNGGLAGNGSAGPQMIGQGQMPPWMQQPGLGQQQQQQPPGWGLDALGPNANPYAMPGTPQYNPNG